MGSKWAALGVVVVLILVIWVVGGFNILKGGNNAGIGNGSSTDNDGTITVTSPSSGDSFALGANCPIRWSNSGSSGSYVQIQMDYGSHDSPLTIVSSTSNDGSYDWTISSDIVPRTNYHITLTSTSSSSVRDDGGSFSITSNSPVSTSIVVTSPSSSSSWRVGTQHTIEWTTSGSVGSNVKIEYDQSSHTSMHTVVTSTPNDGSYSWTLPSDLLTGSYYVRVKSTTISTIYDDSPGFQITTAGGSSITVGIPGGNSYLRGDSCNIQWTSSGSVGSYVKVEYDYSTFSTPVTIIASTSNDGSYSWTIPQTMALKTNWFVRVTSTSSLSIFGDSSFFEVRQSLTAPALVSPSDRAVEGSSPVYLDWSTVSSATAYKVQVDDSSGFSSTVVDATTSSSSYSASGSFVQGSTYYWRVAAGDGSTWGQWSGVRSFIYASGTISRTFEWSYGGYSWTWNTDLPADDYYDYKSRPRTYDWPSYITSSDPTVNAMANALKVRADEKGFDSFQTVSFVMAFVQCLPYTSDSVTTGHNDYPRYPVETLVDNGGDCEDTSILFAALLQNSHLNYDCVLFEIPNDNPTHMAVGVRGAASVSGSYVEFDGYHYYYCETTGDGFEIGETPPEYAGVQVRVVRV